MSVLAFHAVKVETLKFGSVTCKGPVWLKVGQKRTKSDGGAGLLQKQKIMGEGVGAKVMSWGSQVLLDRVEAKAPCSVLFAPPTSLQRVVCVMNQIHWV